MLLYFCSLFYYLSRSQICFTFRRSPVVVAVRPAGVVDVIAAPTRRLGVEVVATIAVEVASPLTAFARPTPPSIEEAAVVAVVPAVGATVAAVVGVPKPVKLVVSVGFVVTAPNPVPPSALAEAADVVVGVAELRPNDSELIVAEATAVVVTVDVPNVKPPAAGTAGVVVTVAVVAWAGVLKEKPSVGAVVVADRPNIPVAVVVGAAGALLTCGCTGVLPE